MNMDSGSSPIKAVLIPRKATPEQLEDSIATVNQPISQLLEFHNLPVEDLLSPIVERQTVIYGLENAIRSLGLDKKREAHYLSKFTIAVCVGLFDGALNFLWDETVKAIRKLIVGFDLEYFLNIAAAYNPRYKHLQDEDDLPAVGDHDLLELCRRMGLINDINHKRLEYVNYMRNHASAAHPNNNQITGQELLSHLVNCISYAIVATPDHSVVRTKQLFDNIRLNIIPPGDYAAIGAELCKLPQERRDDFMRSLVGLFVDPRTDPKIKFNIEGISPHFWQSISEEAKYFIGSKYGVYTSNADIERKNSIQRFLEVNSALGYKDESSLIGELFAKLQDLKTVHYEWNNFYNEYPLAASIQASIPVGGIPPAIRSLFVKVICICDIGNGKGYREGVDVAADRIYVEFIRGFGLDEIKEFVSLFADNEFLGDLNKAKPFERVKRLAEYFKTITQDVSINQILDLVIRSNPYQVQQISSSPVYKNAMKFIK